MNDIVEALTDDQLQRLKDGEEIKVCTKIREPLFGGKTPHSINTITIQMTTSGLFDEPDSIDDLPDKFDEVIGVEEAVEEYKDD